MSARPLNENWKGQIAYLSKNIWIGNFQACDNYHKKFDKVLHVYHDEQPGHCSQMSQPLAISYLEGSRIDESLMEDVWQHAQGDGKLLVHCAAGIGRSALFSLVCLAARGEDVFIAMYLVAEGMWWDYEIKQAPNFISHPLTDIIKFCEKKAGK